MAARRTAVAKHPGVYYRELPGGRRRYEITWLDPGDGRRRWKMVEGNLEAADAALAEVKGRLRRGEPVGVSKMTFGEVADEWFASQVQLRGRTREWYSLVLRVHLKPRVGRVRVSAIGTDDVLRVVGELSAAGYSAWTVRGVLVPFGRVMSYAVRRGLASANPVSKLERGERPRVVRRDVRVLTEKEIGRLLKGASKRYRPIIAAAIFTGARQGELLGLVWDDVRFEEGVIRIRKQLGRDGVRVAPKTPNAVRDVVLLPGLARILREHRLGSPFSKPEDFVFAAASGGPLYYRNVVRRGLEKAVERAGLPEEPKLRWHDLRHNFASFLIAEGLDVVFVSRQLGHASPSTTLSIYAHLFDASRHAEEARAALEARFGTVLSDGLSSIHEFSDAVDPRHAASGVPRGAERSRRVPQRVRPVREPLVRERSRAPGS